jgi:hypothetical protein
VEDSKKTSKIATTTPIKGSEISKDVAILSGKFFNCKTHYFADHENYPQVGGSQGLVYLNNARYLKVRNFYMLTSYIRMLLLMEHTAFMHQFLLMLNSGPTAMENKGHSKLKGVKFGRHLFMKQFVLMLLFLVKVVL